MSHSNIVRLINEHARRGGEAGGTAGLQIGLDATNYKIGFWGTTPVDQPAAIASLTDSSGGTADATVEAVGATNGTADRAGAINNNFAELATKVNAILTALREPGIIDT